MPPPGWTQTVVGQNIFWTHPQSTMDVTSLPPDFFTTFSPTQQATELIWRHGLANLPNTDNEIVLPHNVVAAHGHDLLRDLAYLLGQHLQTQVASFWDRTISAFRIRSVQNLQFMPIDQRTHKMVSDLVREAAKDGLPIPLEPAHIPRPPNSFILYRQHYHHTVTADNPGTPNTEISRIIADMWRNETPAVRNRFKELAGEKKRLHAKTYPNYQYSPRRPSEKVRRTPRIHMNNLPWLGGHPLGQQLVADAFNSNGYIPIDKDFLAAMDAFGILHGPNGVAPMPVNDTFHFESDVEKQVARCTTMEVARWVPLQGNEFDDAFPMDELLDLEGA